MLAHDTYLFCCDITSVIFIVSNALEVNLNLQRQHPPHLSQQSTVMHYSLFPLIAYLTGSICGLLASLRDFMSVL